MRRREHSDNPFRPGFGAAPPELAGRRDMLDRYDDAFVPGAWSRGRATILIGHRGIGKTSLLTAMERRAKAAGWAVASVTARPGVVRELVDDRLPRLSRAIDPRARDSSLTSLSLAGVSAARTVTQRHATAPTLRGRVEDFLALPGVRGLVFSIDELNPSAGGDLAEVFDVVQHGFRDDLPIALLGAGLYPDVSAMLRQHGVTFLHRAETIDVPPLTFDEARDAIRIPVEQAGRRIDAQTLDLAATVSQGYPYLTQVIGAEAWDNEPDELDITRADVEHAYGLAPGLMGNEVIRPTLSHIPDAPLGYLLAMAEDEGPSRARDLEARLATTSNNVANLRRRLLEDRLIFSAGHGLVDYTLPYQREYLRERLAERSRTVSVREVRGTFPPLPPRA